VGMANGSETYIPIRALKRDSFGSPSAGSKELLEKVKSQSNKLTGLLMPNYEIETFNAVAYSFREIIRNVFEHAGVDECFIQGQRMTSGVIEVAILDEGCGIRTSLSKAYPTSSDNEALDSCILPGVSSRSRDLEESENSGFGLYVLSEIGRCFGRFVLCSGKASLKLSKRNPPAKDEADVPGTLVSLRLDQPPRNMQALLEDIVMRGEEEMGQQRQGQRRNSPSKLLNQSLPDLGLENPDHEW
jgi:hypothetical protein